MTRRNERGAGAPQIDRTGRARHDRGAARALPLRPARAGAGAAALALALCGPAAHAVGAEEARGLWLTAEKDAVVQFAPCADRGAALCGTIVWDKDAGTDRDTCGTRIAQLEHYEREAWRDGWVFDPRDGKRYRGVVRVAEDVLQLRAFVGTELLGQTERMTRVAALPTTPQCRR